MRFDAVPPATDARRCETFNGNVVLISAEVARRVGPIDAAFTHSMGDLDYGLRAGRHGCEVWLAPGTVGTCTGNPPPARWKDGSLPLRTRLALVRGPKGLPPREWFVFTRRYGGVGWPLYWASPYVRTVLARPRG
jgi:GT2 family glycosyltransferase